MQFGHHPAWDCHGMMIPNVGLSALRNGRLIPDRTYAVEVPKLIASFKVPSTQPRGASREPPRSILLHRHSIWHDRAGNFKQKMQGAKAANQRIGNLRLLNATIAAGICSIRENTLETRPRKLLEQSIRLLMSANIATSWLRRSIMSY